MMKAALQNYQARMQRVLDHMDRHLDDDLDLDAMSGVAAFSKYHCHRQFTATFDLSVHRYVELARMKRASYRLAYVDDQSVTSPADYSMDLCVGTDRPIEANGEQIKAGEIPGGRCAVLRRRQHRQSGARRALPLSRAASRQRRGNRRLPDLLPAAELLPGGARA
jgi:AraC-like DNA-binding protein